MMIAVPLELAASPLRNGRELGDANRSALVIGGTGKIRTGGAVVFCKVVAVAEAQVRRDGRVRAKGSPVHHATLGPLEEKAGTDVTGGIAERVPLRARFVKGERERLLARAFMIRVVVLMTLMPGARVQDVIAALAGDLALVPWARPWRPASARSAGEWRNALGPVPLEELRDLVLGSAWREHQGRGCPGAVTIGTNRPLRAGSLDGTLLRVPDTPANRAFFGSVGTSDDSGPYPSLRALPLTCCSCRALFAMPHGPAGTDKAAAEQKLLDEAMDRYPHLLDPGWIWLIERNYHGAPRIARMIRSAHVLIRLKSDIPLRRTSEILPDCSYRAELSGDGVTIAVRVIGCWVTVEGQQVPEMFCLVTDLMDWEDYPAAELAALYKWRWDGWRPRCARPRHRCAAQARAPGHAPLRVPDLVRQELAAWAAGTGMARGVVIDAALAAAPAAKDAGPRSPSGDLSFARAVRAVLSAIRLGHDCYQAVTSQIGRHGNVVDRDRHRSRTSKSPSSFAHAGPADPDLPGRHHHGQQPGLTSENTEYPLNEEPRRAVDPAATGAARRPPACRAGRNYPQ